MIKIIIKKLPIYHYDGFAHFPAAFSLFSILFKEILYAVFFFFFTIEKVVKLKIQIGKCARKIMPMRI